MAREISSDTLTEGPMVLAKGLRRNFGNTVAVRDLDLRVEAGEVFGLVGPDGAGKTTTLRMLAGILTPSSGEVWVDGISVLKDPESVKDHIAYMPQRFGLYQDLTVIENLLFYADLFRVPQKERPPRLDKLFAFSRLGPFKDRLAGALSGGMKQKLGLACALIHEPRLLLLDEPTNGVDPVSRRDFWQILYDLVKDGMTIVVSTAYLDESERANRVELMSRGRIIRQGRPQDLKRLVEGVMYELAPSDVRVCAAELSGMEEVLGASVFGGSLHVRVADEASARTVRDRLSQAGVEVNSMRKITPSMEDAFLSLIPMELQDAAPPQES